MGFSGKAGADICAGEAVEGVSTGVPGGVGFTGEPEVVRVNEGGVVIIGEEGPAESAFRILGYQRGERGGGGGLEATRKA